MDLPPQVYCPLCGRPCQIDMGGTTACSEGHHVKLTVGVPKPGPPQGGLRTKPEPASWRDRGPML